MAAAAAAVAVEQEAACLQSFELYESESVRMASCVRVPMRRRGLLVLVLRRRGGGGGGRFQGQIV